MGFIELQDIIRVYKTGRLEVQALRGLSLILEEGAYVSFVGPSGSGKTTLLNIIGGVDQPTAGTLRIGEYDLQTMTDQAQVLYRRNVVGYVFQNFNLLPTLTAAENVELSMIAANTKKTERSHRVDELLTVVDLIDRKGHMPSELSGGEQQRVALASALANDPPILLADEPTGELDTENAQLVMKYFKRINHEFGKTILIATHDARMARQTQQIFQLKDGRITTSYMPVRLDADQSSVAIRYADQLQIRIQTLQDQIKVVKESHSSGAISSEEFVQKHREVTLTLKVLKAEYHRMGY